MKIFKSIGSGAVRALKSWKCILIVWLVSLLLVALYVIPAKGILKAGFGQSTVTELLTDGINIEAISDLEQYLSSLQSYFSSGLLLLIFLGILVNTFLTGGLFKSVGDASLILSVPCFFRASGKYFLYFLGLYLMISLMILFSGVIIMGLPFGLIYQAGDPSAGTMMIAGIICGALFVILALIFMLVADYSRAWLIAADKPAFFKALGFGFNETFRHFWSSLPMMLIIMFISILYGWVFVKITSYWRPESGGGVFLLFITSQLLIIIKILLKTWRYGSVTALMENNVIGKD